MPQSTGSAPDGRTEIAPPRGPQGPRRAGYLALAVGGLLVATVFGGIAALAGEEDDAGADPARTGASSESTATPGAPSTGRTVSGVAVAEDIPSGENADPSSGTTDDDPDGEPTSTTTESPDATSTHADEPDPDPGPGPQPTPGPTSIPGTTTPSTTTPTTTTTTEPTTTTTTGPTSTSSSSSDPGTSSSGGDTSASS